MSRRIGIRRFAAFLQPQGVQTVSAHSGREALNLIESTPVHVAVLDAQMPQLGGLQVIRLLRELHKADAGDPAGQPSDQPPASRGAGHAGLQRPEQAGGF